MKLQKYVTLCMTVKINLMRKIVLSQPTFILLQGIQFQQTEKKIKDGQIDCEDYLDECKENPNSSEIK